MYIDIDDDPCTFNQSNTMSSTLHIAADATTKVTLRSAKNTNKTQAQ